MSDNTLKNKRMTYEQLCHAMQTGVALCLEHGLTKDTEPKHLRVGINAAMSDHAALVGLLIKKGILTEEEYLDALIDGMTKEVEAYYRHLRKVFGDDFILG